ncbi:hypothetical protein N7466_001452 [Penicillium verhagenii]|uniref:uncharacterized protein n=1 Tax=Penicillium verhagenii TaxID=1562060 RepID=UPI0025457F08|nr:uncharacterized protein N7466_001452 [Penicillium verhagenii]KAJ5938318.1 hypothetical protein N7466_001452 [Penicillium verhagenii]
MNSNQPERTNGNAPDEQGVASAKQRHRPLVQGLFSLSEPPSVIYEGYKFFQADPIPGETASWTKVERTQMIMKQDDFCWMVQERANKISAAQQYLLLSEIRQAHVNQLIAEKRPLNPEVEWSCVYAKEHEEPFKARNAHRNDYEVVYMQIILMQRPVNTSTHCRTPMGDLVDLGAHFGTRPGREKWASDKVDHDQRWSVTDEKETTHEESVHLSWCHHLHIL